MANIPAEKKSGGSILPWIIGLLVLLGLIWLLFELFDDDDVVEEPIEDDLGVVEEPVTPAAAGAITSFDELVSADAAGLVGREVDLEDLDVGALSGDSSFFAAPTPGSDEAVLVVLEDLGEWRVGPGDGSDGVYDVNAGNTVDLSGVVRSFDASTPDYADLTAADRERVLQQGRYIAVTSAEALTKD